MTEMLSKKSVSQVRDIDMNESKRVLLAFLETAEKNKGNAATNTRKVRPLANGLPPTHAIDPTINSATGLPLKRDGMYVPV